MMFARRPPIADPWSFIRIFSPFVWSLTLGSILTVTAVMILANYLAETNKKICNLNFSETVTKLMMDIVGMFLQQGKFV